jgi:hypothetical protein
LAVDLDDGGIDHGLLHIGPIRAGLEKPNENIGLFPVAVSLKDGIPVAEDGRQVTLRAARAHNPQDRFDEASVVTTAASGVGRLAQTMRFHLRPLGVSQYESFNLKL